MLGVTESGLVVAIRGLLRVDASDRADLQPNASYRARLAGEESKSEGTTQPITFSTSRRQILCCVRGPVGGRPVPGAPSKEGSLRYGVSRSGFSSGHMK